MATVVNVHEAKTHLSRLLERVAMGEEIVLAKAGRPVARLVPVTPHVRVRRPGSARNLVRIGPDFDAPLPEEILKGFE